jgi:hypothetical protein
LLTLFWSAEVERLMFEAVAELECDEDDEVGRLC